MLLIDFVMMGAAQRLLLKSKADQGELLIKAIEQSLYQRESEAGEINKALIETLLKKSDFACAVVLSSGAERHYTVGSTGVPQGELVHATRRALSSKHLNTQLTGSTWGVFWRQKANLVLSAPLYNGETPIAGISIVLHLQQVYRQLRRAQHFVFIYILINLILLTFIGRYRFSRLTILPLKNLVDTAEAYREGGETLFLGSENEGNEFNQLSNALNQMLNRISKDQENLKLTVSSLKQSNLDLKKAQNDIINAEKLASVGRLSAGIAHEIGNPIAIIMGYLELLKRKDISGSERKDFIARTENEIHRINHIIQQLLDFSRPSNNAVGRISIHEILSDIGDIFKYQPLMKNMDFRLSLMAAADDVRADAALLRQAFLNLVINAADAVKQAGRSGALVVETRNISGDAIKAETALLEIMFTDNGAGIAKDQLNYIFEPFFTTKAPGKGTGLGLSVCYMIIEASDGRITVQSEEGTGTKMIITLPLCTGEGNLNA